MTKELSAKDQRMKAMMEKTLANPEYTLYGRFRKFYSLLPSDPRCAACLAPFEGTGGAFVRTVLNKRRSRLNPLFCNQCEESARRLRAGVETEMSMLFADIRGSTSLAETMDPTEFKQLIERFYREATRVLAHSLAQIDKLVGDEVIGYYLPGFLGTGYAKAAVDAAQELLRVTGHYDAGGPWVPVGVGINTGKAYFGTVGSDEDLVEITALGDEVNVAARLASQASAGEVVISQRTAEMGNLDTTNMVKRTLSLKGKSEPMDVWVLKAKQS